MSRPRNLSKKERAFNAALGARIKEQRLVFLWGKRELAKELDVIEQDIGNMENGTPPPNVHELNQICEIFRVGVDEMLYEARESINGLVRVVRA